MADKVRVLARWDGFCAACDHDARPLVLTLAGLSGPAAWWQGVAWEDRALSLTCRVCGGVQQVPWDETDDPEVVLTEDPAPVVVTPAAPAPRAPLVVDLVRRSSAHAPSPVQTDSPDDVLDLLHLDLSRG